MVVVVDPTGGGGGSLRQVKVGSRHTVHDTQVCEDITKIRRSAITIYGY